jgi:hypothetical protein
MAAMFAVGGTLMAAELPVRKVILYKHGVGYFERTGDLGSGETARLDFKSSDMNDVLKSLTILDKSGAKVTGLRYDASEPLDKRLADYPFQLAPRQALSHFIDQMKGASLEIRTAAGQTLTGTIVGARTVAMGDKSVEKEVLTLLLDSGEIRTFDMDSLSYLKLADEALQRQLKDYLATLAVARSKEKRSVYIDSSDNRSRQVTASYMIPMPSWKSSYRLIFGAAGTPAEATLEGWAIVDNTTGEDWNKVSLSLVSGRPISFISQLYEPRYRNRPTAELAEERALAPTVYGGALQSAPPPPAAAPAGVRAARRAPQGKVAESEMMELSAAAPQAAFMRDSMESSVQANMQGRELGDLFEYQFGNSVTVRRNESAMLPFLQQKVGARKLLIYSDRSMNNPMTAAEITNSSGKTLDGGPITVYDDNAYAGEALVETFKANDKRLISYGVDLGTRITTNLDSSRDTIREIKAQRGILTTRTALEEKLTYTIRNVDARAKTLIIEHPVRQQYTLLTPKQPSETTANAYRFEVKLAPSAEEKFVVAEEYLYQQTLSILNITPDQLGVFLQNRNLSAAGRKQLEGIRKLKEQIATTDDEIEDVEMEIEDVFKDQERIRQNLTSLNRVTGQQEQVNRYAKELADQEARLATMRDRQSQLRRQKDQLLQQLNSLIEKLEF